MDALFVADDGLPRCVWCAAAPDYVEYHDGEWGQPVHGDRALFERITLEAFQSGLSWLTILRKRESFRRSFAEFDIDAVAGFTVDDVERLMGEPSIVRNRKKIEATLTNARAAQGLIVREGAGALDRLVWSFAPPARIRRPGALADVPAQTDESRGLSNALKSNGFVFVGPTTMYAAMQACGLIDDHVAGCHRAA